MTVLAACGLGIALALAGVDVRIAAAMRGLGDHALARALAAITDVALVQWYLVPAAALVAVLAALDWRRRPLARRACLALAFGQAAYAFAAIAVAQLLVRVAKFLIGRGRPETLLSEEAPRFDPLALENLYWSFPSGHSATAGALAMILALWFPRLRWAAGALGVLLGVSRVAAGAHFASDVAAGLTVGALTALAIARWLASRGLVFRLAEGALLPLPRFRRRAATPGRGLPGR